MLQEKQCPLCHMGKILQENHMRLYGDEITETNFLFDTDNFYIIADNYPVCDCELLIVPKVHVCSYSNVNLDLSDELEAIIKTLKTIVGVEKYGLFEHGSNKLNDTYKRFGNSVDHAHLQFIPYMDIEREHLLKLCIQSEDNPVITLKKNNNFTDCCINKKPDQSILDYIKTLPTKKPYLFCYYSNITGETLFIPDEKMEGAVPSQFFRRVFAEYFQKTATPFWNWKEPKELEKSVGFRKEILKRVISIFKNREKVKDLFRKYFTCL